ncbi:hypothetical protein CPB84DRAFT_1763793, partial [Gymnopilus junonius]
MATNYRNTVNNFCQYLHFPRPVYHEGNPQGPEHDPLWTSTVYIKDMKYGSGTGGSKDSARERAARAALVQLHTEKPGYLQLFP